jgi:hypothetical protein
MVSGHGPIRCLVIGVWVAHIGLFICVSDCVQPHDSSLTVELIVRALEKAKKRYNELRFVWPEELLIFAFVLALQAGVVCFECLL